MSCTLAQPVIPLTTFWLIPAEPGDQSSAMAAHTPLPPNLRRGLAAFSGSLFINNKTRDSGAAHTYPPGTGSAAGGLGRGLLLGTAPMQLGTSEVGTPKGTLHPPTKGGQK